MKIILSSKRHNYLAMVSIFLITVALIAGIVGCVGGESYALAIASAEGGSVTTPGEGVFTYDEGTVVNLTAEAEEGYRFVSWTGDVGTVADVEAFVTTITINGDYVITANFVTAYSLTISSSTGGNVTIPGEGAFTYDEGTMVNLVAEAQEGYYFVDWTGDVGTISDVNAAITTITMNYSCSITANFLEDGVVYFPDANLEAAIREAIEKPTGDIYRSDLLGLTSFDASERSISDIKGLEHCFHLDFLSLWRNEISDISALSSLIDLTTLYLGENQISDISPLSSLANLTTLYLWENEISDISPLSSLSNLTTLYLYRNAIPISDISALSSLINLSWLCLDDNQISDISALSSLINLTNLALKGNQISDISALSSLTNLTYLALFENQVSNITALSSLTNLTSLGLHDNQISDISALSSLTNLSSFLSLSENQISDISSLSSLTNLSSFLSLSENQISDISSLSSLTNLTVLWLYSNQISNISPLANLTNLTYVDIHLNQISDISPLVENEGLSEGDEVDLRWNPLSSDSLTIYIPQLEARGVTVNY